MFILIEGGQAMSKEAVFTMKLEPELREAFMAEALASHRPASQLMRELMRDFVQRQREAREYGDFLRAKVDKAREQVRAGNLAGGNEVEARFAARRAQLRAATGDAMDDGGGAAGAGSGAVA